MGMGGEKGEGGWQNEGYATSPPYPHTDTVLYFSNGKKNSETDGDGRGEGEADRTKGTQPALPIPTTDLKITG